MTKQHYVNNLQYGLNQFALLCYLTHMEHSDYRLSPYAVYTLMKLNYHDSLCHFSNPFLLDVLSNLRMLGMTTSEDRVSPFGKYYIDHYVDHPKLFLWIQWILMLILKRIPALCGLLYSIIFYMMLGRTEFELFEKYIANVNCNFFIRWLVCMQSPVVLVLSSVLLLTIGMICLDTVVHAMPLWFSGSRTDTRSSYLKALIQTNTSTRFKKFDTDMMKPLINRSFPEKHYRLF